MSSRALLWLFAAIIVIAGAVYFLRSSIAPQAPVFIQTSTSTALSDLGSTVIYRNTTLGFSVSHPGIMASSEVEYGGYLPVTQTPAASFVLPRSLFAGTNLGEAGVYIGATSSPAILSVCTRPSTEVGEATSSIATWDGGTWNVFTSVGAGAGNIYDEKVYRTVHGGYCFEIVELLHSGNIGNYPEGAVVEFDRQKYADILESIVATFQFTK